MKQSPSQSPRDCKLHPLFLVTLTWTLTWTWTIPAETLTLGDAQAQLFANNPAITAAGTNVQKAKAVLSESQSAWWPSIDASGSYTYQSDVPKIEPSLLFPVPGIPAGEQVPVGFKSNILFGADLTYPFFTGFSRHYTVAEGRESISQKQATLDATKNAASLLLGITYLQWILAYRQVAVQRMYIEDLDSFSTQSENRYKAGTVLESAVLEAQASLQFANADLVSDLNRIDSLRQQILAMILGKDQSIMPDTSTGASLDTMKLPSAIDTARPELVAFDHAAEQVRFARRALNYRHFPTISGDLGGRYGRPGLNLNIDNFMGWGLVGVAAKWNLFDGFKTRAKDAELQQDLDYIEISKTQQLQSMTTSFEDAKRQILAATDRLAACEASLKASTQLAKERKEQVVNGAATSTDYLNSLARLAQARLQVEQAKVARRIAMLQQKYAAGKEIRY